MYSGGKKYGIFLKTGLFGFLFVINSLVLVYRPLYSYVVFSLDFFIGYYYYLLKLLTFHMFTFHFILGKK